MTLPGAYVAPIQCCGIEHALCRMASTYQGAHVLVQLRCNVIIGDLADRLAR